MNYKSAVIAVAVIVMLLSPTAFGIIMGGQAFAKIKSDSFDKSDIEDVTVELYITSTGEKISLDLEEYITRVMMAEVPFTFERESLKSMAVAIRSYCLRRMNEGVECLEHFSADMCDDYTHCLGYISLKEAEARWGADSTDVCYKTIEEAVKETEGEVLCYNGIIADAVFHECSPNVTESAENIWGFEVPYLVSVGSEESVCEAEHKFTAEEMKGILENESVFCNLSADPSTWIGSISKNCNNRVDKVEFGGTVVTGRRMREMFGLESASFDLFYNGENFVFKVFGRGHGVGMSMNGCNELAKKGVEYTDILAHYYTGAKLEMYSSDMLVGG